MAGSDMYIQLGLDASEFQSRLKECVKDADIFTKKGFKTIIKADFNFPKSKDIQKELSRAVNAAQGITYTGRGGRLRSIGKNDLKGVLNAYTELEKKIDRGIKLTLAEEGAHKRLTRAMIAARNFGNARMQQANRMQTEIITSTDKLIGRFSKLGTVIAKYFGLFGIINFGKKIIETTGYFEQQQVALEGIVGSAQKASSLLNKIKDFAIQSPFQTKELVTFTKQLAAFSVPADELFETTKRLADISAGLGVDMSRIILAYGQVKSASVLRGQELRQFTEAGIPMVDALAKKFSELRGEIVSTGEVFELISNRQVSFDMVSEVLTDMTSEGGKFYKMQENITDTLYGQVQKMKDMFTITLNDIGGSMNGLLMGIVKIAQFVVKNIVGIGAAISVAFSTRPIVNFITHFIRLVKVTKAWHKTGHSILTLFKGGIWGAAVAAVLSLVGVIGQAIFNARELSRRFKEVENNVAKETKKMTEGLDELLIKMKTNAQGTKEYADAVETLVQNYGQFLNSDIINRLKDTESAARMTAEAFSEMANNIKQAIVAYGQYKEYDEKKELLKDRIEKNSEKYRFERFSLSGTVGPWGEQTYKDTPISNRSDEEIERFFKLFRYAQEEFLNGEDFSFDAFRDVFTEYLNTVVGITKEEVDYLNEEGYKIIKSSKNFNKLKEVQQKQSDTDYAKYVHAFDAIKPEGLITSYTDAIDYNKQSSILLLDKLYDIIDKNFTGENAKKLLDEIHHEILSFNNQSVHNVSRALSEFRNTFTDPAILNNLDMLNNNFVKKAGEKTGRAADVSDKIEKNAAWRKGDAISTFVQQYIPTDSNYKEQREAIKKEYDNLTNELNSYQDKNNAKDLEKIKDIKERIDVLKTLASADYYNIDLSKKTSGRSISEQVPEELSDFINKLKDAYTTYRTATQSQGSALGAAYMKTDQKMIERFNDFFHGATDSSSFDGLKIGGKSIGEMLQDAFLEGGIEDGVIDFEKAINKVADALHNYAAQAPKQRKQFESAAKSLRKWGETTFSKDNVQGWIEDVNKAFTDLKKTFEKTNQQVELYRKLMQNGTAGKLGKFAGDASKQVFTPNSILQLGNIDEMIKLFNAKLNEQYDKGNVAQADRLGFINIDTSSLNSVPAIQAAIAQVSEQMKLNNDNFTANPALGETGKTLESMLDNYLNTIIDELSSISGEIFTGNALSDAIANGSTKAGVAQYNYEKQEGVAMTHGTFDAGALKAYIDELNNSATSIFDQFLATHDFSAISQAGSYFGGKRIDFETMRKKLEDVMKQLPEDLARELKKKFDDLEIKVNAFNAAGGDIKAFSTNLSTYSNAGKIAKQRYDDKITERKGYETSLEYLTKQKADEQEQLDNAAELGLSAEEIEVIKQSISDINQEILSTQVALTSCNQELEEMGVNGQNFENSMKNDAVNNMLESLNSANGALSKLSETVNSVVNAAKALSKVINKTYDVMNDGENPEWMQDMDEFLGDFGEAFEMLIAPIAAVIAMVIALIVVTNLLGVSMSTVMAVMLPLVAVAAIIAAIIAAFQQHDRALQHDIDALDDKIEGFQNAITNLNAAAERQVGLDKFGTRLKAVGKNLSIASAEAEKARLEEEKKNTDEDKLEEYKQNSREAMDEYLNSMREMFQELTKSTEDWSSSMGDAIRSAFQNGENAARAFRSTIKEMMGDVIANLLQMKILEPLMDAALEEWSGAEAARKKYQKKDKDGILVPDTDKILDEVFNNLMDEDKAKKFESTTKKIGDSFIDYVDSMPEYLQDLFKYKSDTSSLSGGIESISEDTARRLEALSNSQLGELLLMRQLLQSIMTNNNYSYSTMSTIQSAVTQMNSNVTILAQMATQIEKHIYEMRNTSVLPLHVTMV